MADDPLTELELDILRFKEGHKVYQDVVKEIIPFVNDMMIDYPEYEFEEIRTAAMRLRSKGWKTPDGVEG